MDLQSVRDEIKAAAQSCDETSTATEDITAEELRANLDYEPNTGIFTWRINGRGRRGGRVGCHKRDGYVQIRVCNRPYVAHRLAWLHVHGEWPAHEIDHINGDRADNRIANLRPATPAQNRANTRLPRTNTSGVKGVSWNKRSRKWQVYIGANRKYRHIGTFSRIEDAAAAYRAAAREIHGEFARVR